MLCFWRGGGMMHGDGLCVAGCAWCLWYVLNKGYKPSDGGPLFEGYQHTSSRLYVRDLVIPTLSFFFLLVPFFRFHFPAARQSAQACNIIAIVSRSPLIPNSLRNSRSEVILSDLISKEGKENCLLLYPSSMKVGMPLPWRF